MTYNEYLENHGYEFEATETEKEMVRMYEIYIDENTDETIKFAVRIIGENERTEIADKIIYSYDYSDIKDTTIMTVDEAENEEIEIY